MKDGREFTEFTKIAKGDPENPITKDELLAKFLININFGGIINHETATGIISTVENIENLDNIRNLVALMV